MKRKITILFICAIMCIFMSDCQKEETMETETKTIELNFTNDTEAVCQDEDRYLLRAIDADGLYYEANGITLKDAYSLKLILNRKDFAACLEVKDGKGDISTYEVFCAAL